MYNEGLSPADSSAPETQRFDLGQWLGRHQALAWIATACSAADAHALRIIREQKLYRSPDLTWEELCRRHAGVSHEKADHIIVGLQEFGDTCFNLSAIVKIPAPVTRDSRRIRSIDWRHLVQYATDRRFCTVRNTG